MKQHAPQPFAEVMQSSLHHVVAQTWQWDVMPSFGALLQIPQREHTVLGIVSAIQTGSLDATRYPFPYQKTEEELRAQQPQIFEFLKTTFEVIVLGYQDPKDNVLYMLPAQPAKIHAFVLPCTLSMVKHFFSKPDYLHLLFASASYITAIDELLLNLLQRLHEYQLLNQATVEQFCDMFSLLSGNDYRRLKLFLGRVQKLVP